MSFLPLLFLEGGKDGLRRLHPQVAEDGRVAGLLPVGVGEAHRIALGVDLPLALEHVRTGLREVGVVGRTDGVHVEGIGVRVDEDAFELAVDDARDHLPEGVVLAHEGEVGPDLGAGVAEPHGRDVAGVDVGVGPSVLILGVMDGGVQGVREALPEHLLQLGMGNLRGDGFRGRIDGWGDEGALLHGRTVGVQFRGFFLLFRLGRAGDQREEGQDQCFLWFHIAFCVIPILPGSGPAGCVSERRPCPSACRRASSPAESISRGPPPGSPPSRGWSCRAGR